MFTCALTVYAAARAWPVVVVRVAASAEARAVALSRVASARLAAVDLRFMAGAFPGGSGAVVRSDAAAAGSVRAFFPCTEDSLRF